MKAEESIIPPLTRPQGRVTVRLYAESYLQRRAGDWTPGTRNNARNAVAEWLAFLGPRADEDMAGVRRADAEAFVAAALWKVRRPTVSKYVGYLGPMSAAAVADGAAACNPFEGLRVPAERTSLSTKPKDFKPEEIQAMLQLLEPEWKSMVLCCICLGGLRLGEIATLRWGQIDTSTGLVSLATGHDKREWKAPLLPPLAGHLATLERQGEYIHPGAAARYLKFGSAPLSIQFIRRLARAGIIPSGRTESGTGRAKLPKTFHSLRTAVANYLANQGIPHAPSAPADKLREALMHLWKSLGGRE